MDARNGGGEHVNGAVAGQNFASALDELKRAGSFLLVTGDVDDSVQVKQARQLFGDPALHRERVLVLTDTTRSRYSDYLPQGMSPDHPSVHLIDYREPLRAETTAETGVETVRPSGVCTLPTASGLTDLRRTITDTVTGIQSRQMSLESGELRVCLTALSVLHDLYGQDATESFIEDMGATVRTAGGIGFCHLAMRNDDPVVQSLRPFFDIHIELRKPLTYQASHRWHLPDHDLTSEWIPL